MGESGATGVETSPTNGTGQSLDWGALCEHCAEYPMGEREGGEIKVTGVLHYHQAMYMYARYMYSGLFDKIVFTKHLNSVLCF